MTRTALYTTAETRELDRTAIEDFGIPGIRLMERAGRATFDHIMRDLGGSSRVLVLCGAGNNGGDGYVVARLLREIGIDTRVVATSEPATVDAGSACSGYLSSGGDVCFGEQADFSWPDLVVDALLGSGLSRAPTGLYARHIRGTNSSNLPVVAVDLPSGLSGDTGQAFDPCIRADSTVTFIGRKIGQFTADGRDRCGTLVYSDLALERRVFEAVQPAAWLCQPPAVTPRPANTHKGRYGHVIIAGGEPGMLGAVLLAGRAALRTGAGLVTVLSVDAHLDKAALSQPELMSRMVDRQGSGSGAFDGADVVVFGPGTAPGDWSRSLFRQLGGLGCPLLLDAGGLRLLAECPGRRDDRVLTPHPGEAAALLDCEVAAIQSDRLGAARALQDRYGGVCVLKGAGTVIAGEGVVEICDKGNPGMASAGMGDVLSGVVGAGLAAGVSAWDAACAGVWWHSAAGDRARDELGEAALLASDVIDRLPTVMTTPIS